jgi:CubicO group peptidase (beta-lactamase class C family)
MPGMPCPARQIFRCLTALLALFALALGAQPLQAGPLQQDLGGLLGELGGAGLVVATIDAEQAGLMALGLAHAPSRRAMREDSLVQVGSITKPVIALALLRLASQGRVALDAPLQQLLPGLPVVNPWAAEAPLRLRHLLDMSAGLEDARLWQMFSRQLDADQPLAQVWQRQPEVLRLRTPPGAQASYSNLGYTLAAQVIEAVVGERYETWVERELLRPLGMHDSTLRLLRQADEPRLAWGHLDGGGAVANLPTALRPAGQFSSTAADMARLARFLMSDGRLHGEPFVDAALLRAMGEPQGTWAARAGLRSGYALGLVRQDRHGAVLRCHGGSAAGHRAMLCLDAGRQKAFFWSMNSDLEGAAYGRIDARLLAELGLVQPLPAPSGAALAPARYEPAPGRYEAFALLGRLQAGPAPLDRLLAVPGGAGLWRLPDRREASHVQLAGTGLVSDGNRSWRVVTPGQVWLPRLSLGLMALALLGGLVWAPVQALRRRRWAPLIQPAWLVTAALPLAGGLMALHGWQALGDLTPGSALLAVATALLPLAWGWMALRALSRRRWAAALTALLVVQGSVLLAAWGLLPLLMWRL